MHGTIRAGALAPTEIGVNVDGRSVGAGRRTVVESAIGWFAEACKRLLPREKPAQALVCDTGFELRDCQRYAAGDVKPSGYFVRALLRSENGWTWLCVVMDAAQPRWWIELQRARQIADAMREIDRK